MYPARREGFYFPRMSIRLETKRAVLKSIPIGLCFESWKTSQPPSLCRIKNHREIEFRMHTFYMIMDSYPIVGRLRLISLFRIRILDYYFFLHSTIRNHPTLSLPNRFASIFAMNRANGPRCNRRSWQVRWVFILIFSTGSFFSTNLISCGVYAFVPGLSMYR